jgi:hypothetical protein
MLSLPVFHNTSGKFATSGPLRKGNIILSLPVFHNTSGKFTLDVPRLERSIMRERSIMLALPVLHNTSGKFTLGRRTKIRESSDSPSCRHVVSAYTPIDSEG